MLSLFLIFLIRFKWYARNWSTPYPGRRTAALLRLPLAKILPYYRFGLLSIVALDPDDALILAEPGELSPAEVVDGVFEALHHLGLAGELTTQPAAEVAVL